MMKPIVRFGTLVLALMLFAMPALAATCPKVAALQSCNATAGVNCLTSSSACANDSNCVSNSCTSGASCVENATCSSPKVTTSKPSVTVTKNGVVVSSGSTCPNVTKKPAATVQPAATAAVNGVTVSSGSTCPKLAKKSAATAQPTAKPTKAPANGASQSSAAASVISQTNDERAKQGLGALKVSSELNRAAAVRAKEIVQKFSHTRPDGRAWSTVSSSVRGENIAMGQQTASKVMAAWMSSSGHRANILRASFGSIGVAAYKVGNTMYWVQLFGA